jgi:hypothetical protein
MTPITLESIKSDADALAAKIATFEAQANQPAAEFYFPEVTIHLLPGEHYAGLIVGKDGEPSHHLVLLPSQADDITWDKAMEWAAKQGGEYVASLPTRREQSLLYANLEDQFEVRWYWSCEAHESESGWAWCQDFVLGHQDRYHEDYDLRARAVRRLPI